MSTFESAKVSGPTPKNCSLAGQVAGLLPAVAPQAAFKLEVQEQADAEGERLAQSELERQQHAELDAMLEEALAAQDAP